METWGVCVCVDMSKTDDDDDDDHHDEQQLHPAEARAFSPASSSSA